MYHSQALQQQLNAALEAKGPAYKARTRHLQENGRPQYINRLILEDSPYLLQHAHNPVDWYPWGEEAFSAAREQNKPIFLSIGYATCHWCHVMEEQSFESITVANLLNAHFICIKVDREQHPDIDTAYMTAVTLFTGHGGWPMSSFLCPDGKPFYAGTYYPQATFLNLLTQIYRVWEQQRETLDRQADELAEAVRRTSLNNERTAALAENLLSTTISSVLSSYDSRHGGFSSAPKFPHEPLLLFLLQSLHRQPNRQLSDAVEHTLSAMAQGGIYDQVGGGFHRYSVDNFWLVPHFEKMLYNQAYLSQVYLHAYYLTGNPLYKRIVHQTLDYVLRDMADEHGLFYSATDADSEGYEGTYFIWEIDEIRRLLPEQDARFVIDLFGMTENGNFEGKNILFLPRSLISVSQQNEQTFNELCQRLDPILATLRDYRTQRIPPLTDIKILVSWNAMMITALAEAGKKLKHPNYIEAAERAATTLWQKQYQNKQLWRVNLQGKTSIPARQDDYVHLAEAFLQLYDTTGKDDYLRNATQLTDEMVLNFLDTASGSFYMGNETLLFSQPKDGYDGALPSGNAVAVKIFSRLYKRCGNKTYLDYANNILNAYADSLNRQPIAYAYMLAQMDELHQGEIADYQYAGNGAVKIESEAFWENNRLGVILNFTVQPGWKLNKPVEISLSDDSPGKMLETITVSDHQTKVLMAHQIDNHSDKGLLKLSVTLQPCNTQQCLPEERVDLFTLCRPD